MPIELRSRTVKKPPPGDPEIVSTKRELNRRPRTEVQTTKQVKKATKSEGARKPSVEEIILEDDEAETENVRKHYKQIHDILTVPLNPPGFDHWNSNLQSIKEKYMCRIANMKKAEAHGSILCKTPLAKKVLGSSVRVTHDTLPKSPDEIIDVFESSVTEVGSVSSVSTQGSKTEKRGGRKPKVKKKVSISIYNGSPWGRVTRATARRLAGSNASSASGQSGDNVPSKKNKAPPKKQTGKKAKDMDKVSVSSELDYSSKQDVTSKRDRKRKQTDECTGVQRIDAIPEFFDFEDLKCLSNAVKKRRMEKSGHSKAAGRSEITNSDISSASSKATAEEYHKNFDSKLKMNPVVRLSMSKAAVAVHIKTNLLENDEDEKTDSKSSVVGIQYCKSTIVETIQSTPATPDGHQESVNAVESAVVVHVEATPIAASSEKPIFTPTVAYYSENAESPNVFESSIVATPVEKTTDCVENPNITSKRDLPVDQTFCKSSSHNPANPESGANLVTLNQTYVNRSATASASNATFAIPSEAPNTPKSSFSNQTFVSTAKENVPVGINVLNSTYAVKPTESSGASTPNVPCPAEPDHRPLPVLATTFTVTKKFPSLSGVASCAKKPSVTASPRKEMGSPLVRKGSKKLVSETKGGLRESASSTCTQDTIKSVTSASTRGSGTSVSKKDLAKTGALGGRNIGAGQQVDRKKLEEQAKLHGQQGLQRLEEKLAEGARKKELYVQQKKDNQRKKNEEWIAKIEKKKAEDAKAEAKAKIDSRAEELKKGYVHKIAAGFAKPLPPSACNSQKQLPKNPAIPHYLKNQGEMTSSCPDISGGSAKPFSGAPASTTLQKIYNSAGNLLVNVFGGKTAHKVPMGPPATHAKPITRTVVYDGDSSSSEGDADDSFATADTTMHSAQNLSTYDITIYEDLNEDMAHRENKRIPDWAKNDARLRHSLFLQQPDLMDRLNMQVFPQKNIGYKLFPTTTRDGY